MQKNDKQYGDDFDFNQYKAIAMVCDNGETVPVSPVNGQWFLHTPTGRNILMMYNGSNWIPIIALGTMTLYVDPIDGTDSIDKGISVDSGAFATLQYTIDVIPPIFTGNIQINLAGEIYAENVVLVGKKPFGNYTITLTGILNTLDSLTCDAGADDGDRANLGTAIRDAGTWTADERQHKICTFTSGSNDGESRIIDSNTTTTLSCLGPWPAVPSAGDTFIVQNWGTIIQKIQVNDNQKGIVLQDLRCNTGGATLTYHNYSEVSASLCSFDGTTTASSSPVNGINFSMVELDACFIQANAASVYGIQAATMCKVQLTRSKIYNFAGGNRAGIWAISGSVVSIKTQTKIDNFDDGASAGEGILCESNSAINMLSTNIGVNGGWPLIHNNDVGIQAQTGGQVFNTDKNDYVGNTTSDENAIAASYGYID